MSGDETSYEITFTVLRREPGEEDFTEIGFGSSGEWDSLDQCAHLVESAVSSGEWETEGDMPDPQDVLNAYYAARDVGWPVVEALRRA